MKITQDTEVSELEIKKLYVPYKITETCPKCGKKLESQDYFSYPKLNSPEEVYFYCDDCNEELTRLIKINIIVTEVIVTEAKEEEATQKHEKCAAVGRVILNKYKEEQPNHDPEMWIEELIRGLEDYLHRRWNCQD